MMDTIARWLYRTRTRNEKPRDGVWYTVGTLKPSLYWNKHTREFVPLMGATQFRLERDAVTAAMNAINSGKPVVVVNRHVGMFDASIETIWVVSKK